MLFKDIAGQAEVKQRLINTVHDHRISHAQLFLGPQGSGKLAMALAYAQYINCSGRSNGNACGSCPSCIKYQKLIHPDLHFIFPVATTKKVTRNPVSKNFYKEWRELLPETHYYPSLSDWYKKMEIENKQAIINAEDCSEIIRTLSYKSYESEYKVMIIWMVEKLFHSAAPKILKILEEPPEKTLFILISENQDQIINTILSRTQIVKFPALKDEDVRGYLDKRNITGNYDEAAMLRVAGGNLRKAMLFAEDSGSDSANFDLFTRWMRLCYKIKVREVADFADQMARNGREAQKNFLNYAMHFMRQCLLMHFKEDRDISLNARELDFSKNFYPFIHTANISGIYEELNTAVYHIERNANASILFMDLSLRINELLRSKAAS